MKDENVTLGLNMIVKNEEHVIERCLSSLTDIIDYYCIVDTGSTDKTKEIITKFFEDKGIKGEIVDHEWVNFSDARNKALESIKGKVTHAVWIDADEVFTKDPGFSVEKFKNALIDRDSATLDITYGDIKYHRKQVFKPELYLWNGPVHEALFRQGDDVEKSVHIAGIGIFVNSDGASWSVSQQEKYSGHAQLYLDWFAADPKNEQPRWVFYLAQSFRDAGNTDTDEGKSLLEKSIEWYRKRVTLDEGYQEERYYAQLMICNLLSKLGKSSKEVLPELYYCSKLDDTRLEHFLGIILYFQKTENYDLAYTFSTRAMKLAGKVPSNKALFIDPAFYLYKIADLHSVNAYYAGDIPEAKRAFRKVLKALGRGLITNPMEVKRIQANKKFLI